MARIVQAAVTRSNWWFGQQCISGGVAVVAGGIGAPRYQSLVLPRCKAIGIAPESEVRAVRIGSPGQPFDSLTDVVEGKSARFNWRGGPVDLARFDWTDGLLVLDIATEDDDAKNLSKLYASGAAVQFDSEAANPVNIWCNIPRQNGIVSAFAVAYRVGGAGVAPLLSMQNLSADRLNIGNPIRSPGGLPVLGVVTTGLSATPTPGQACFAGGRSHVYFTYPADAGAVITGMVGARMA